MLGRDLARCAKLGESEATSKLMDAEVLFFGRDNRMNRFGESQVRAYCLLRTRGFHLKVQ